MKLKIAINGFGDIGRNILRAIYSNDNNKLFEIVAINDLSGSLAAVHALRYDKRLPSFEPTIGSLNDSILIGRDKIPFFMEMDISRLPWKKLEVDFAIECAPHIGNEQPDLEHQKAGARRVLIPSHTLNSKQFNIPTNDQFNHSNTNTRQRNNQDMLSVTQQAIETTKNPYWNLANKTLLDARSMRSQ